MINFKFVKSQFKIIKIEIITIFIILIILSISVLTMPMKYFSPYNSKETGGRVGASEIYMLMFSIPAMILFPALSIILLNKLLLKEINKGYFGCWLMANMSRKTILNSKFFTIIVSMVLVNISIYFIQLILFFSVFRDFDGQMAGYLFLYFLSLIFVSFLFTNIVWMIICNFFSKKTKAISIATGLLTIFILFFIMGKNGSAINSSGLKCLNYFTIMSFLKHIEFHDASKNKDLNLGTLKIFDWKNFAWQLPIMLISGGGLFVGGNLIFKQKDLHL